MEITITSFSDTHTYHEAVTLPASDIVIFSGDFSHRGSRDDTERFMKWYAKQDQCEHKILVAGNHDLCLDPRFDRETGADMWINELITEYQEKIMYLQCRNIEVMGLKIWGCAVTPDFHPQYWAFNKPRGGDIREFWELIPERTDIIVTHGPVYEILDKCDGGHVGCEDLAEVVQRIKPRMHVCGHIHEGYGVIKENETTYVNASICNAQYVPLNLPITTILDI